MAKKKIIKREPEIEEEVWEEIDITDPKTGKKSKMRVKVQKLKPVTFKNGSTKDEDVVDRLNQIGRNYIDYE